MAAVTAGSVTAIARSRRFRLAALSAALLVAGTLLLGARAAPTVAAIPFVRTSDTTPFAGQWVRITGGGFRAGAVLSIRIGSTRMATARASTAGTFAVDARVPSVRRGSQALAALRVADGRVVQRATRSISVTSIACTARVDGLDAAAVHRARDAAGTGGVVCFPAGTYSGALTASSRWQTWLLEAGAIVTGMVRVTGPGTTIRGGTIERPTTDRWASSVRIEAHDAAVQGVAFRGGGQVVTVHGVDRTRITSNTFVGQRGSAIAIWSEGVGADETLIEGNTITQTVTNRVSPITSRGNESITQGGIQNLRTVVRGNTIDQGAGDVGWFGIEFKQSARALIEGNTIRGGRVLISFPETNAAIIRNNTLDMRGTPFWGIEIANSLGVTVEGNTFLGDRDVTAISHNSGSRGSLIRLNRAALPGTFVDLNADRGGGGHTIRDNCLTGVLRVTRYADDPSNPSTVTANGAC